MLRSAFLLKLVISCSLAALVSAALVASASAAEELPFRSPALKVCKLVLTGWIGLYTEAHCQTDAVRGSWAWSTPAAVGKGTWYCLLSPTIGELYTEGLCQTHASGNEGVFLTDFDLVGFPRLNGLVHLSVFKGKVLGVSVTIHCTHGTLSLQPESGSLAGEGAILYVGCEPSISKCAVTSASLKKEGEIETATIMGTSQTASLLAFVPETGTKFVELEFKDKGTETCSLNGSLIPVTGKQRCTYTSNIEEPAEEHNLLCKENESELELGGTKTTYEGLVLTYLGLRLFFKIR